MGPLALFDLASRQNHWHSQRLSVIAGNVANANTPDYKARDIEPFEAVVAATADALRVTHARHLTSGDASARVAATRSDADTAQVHHSGNAVSLDGEFLKAGEVSRSMAFNVGVMKAFHRMLLASGRG